MSRFFDALTTKNLLTENGMPTHSTSGSFVVDFFYEMGGFRKNASKPISELVGLFFAAFGENPNLAMKALFNLRDPRDGMGEKNSPRVIWHFLAQAHPDLVRKFIPYIPAYGMWKDLFYLLETPVEDDALQFLWFSLQKGDKLAAKWTPRENKTGIPGYKPGEIAHKLMKKFELSPKEYRKILSRNTEVVETAMCEKRWEKIKFESVPSVAMKNYYKAFLKHQEERFRAYLAAVEKGEKKMNTGVLSPVDIVERILPYNSDKSTLNIMWSQLKDVVPENLDFLPICDLSGSMSGTPMNVSISLGIYLAQHNKGRFKNGFITFSQKPTFIQLTGKTLWDNIQIMKQVNLAQNTDLEAVFLLILNQAVNHGLSQEDLPDNLLIISDMQFDECLGKNRPNVSNWGAYGKSALEKPFDNTALEMIKRMYREAGYIAPNVFFWNVRTSSGIPAKITDNGVGLISGYSPNLLAQVLTGDLNPLRQVEAILNNGNYDFVSEIL